MAEKLSIFDGVNFEEVITKEQYHTYYPRTSHFNLNDEVRIQIQNQDIYTLPSESYIYIEGKFSQGDGTGQCVLTNNAYAFLFDNIRYELNGVEIDRCLKPGITSTMKTYISSNTNESRALEMAGWCPSSEGQPTYSAEQFNACIPLKFLLGFAEDYKKIIMNASQELILTRSKTDDNCYKNKDENGTKKASITIEKIEWHVPHIWVNDETRLALLEALRSNKPIYIPFRKWELHELPSLRTTKTDIWPVKTSTNLEKPRYVIVAFQKNRKDNYRGDAAAFDHCATANIKLYLNSESYPYNQMNLDMGKKQYVIAYHSYTTFQESYYNRPGQPLLDYNTFATIPLYVIDCSKQNESLKSATVDIKLEMESREAFKKDTTAYCLILHDNIVEYAPLTGIVKKIV